MALDSIASPLPAYRQPTPGVSILFARHSSWIVPSHRPDATVRSGWKQCRFLYSSAQDMPMYISILMICYNIYNTHHRWVQMRQSDRIRIDTYRAQQTLVWVNMITTVIARWPEPQIFQRTQMWVWLWALLRIGYPQISSSKISCFPLKNDHTWGVNSSIHFQVHANVVWDPTWSNDISIQCP